MSEYPTSSEPETFDNTSAESIVARYVRALVVFEKAEIAHGPKKIPKATIDEMESAQRAFQSLDSSVYDIAAMLAAARSELALNVGGPESRQDHEGET